MGQIFSSRVVEQGFRKAFKGDWGSEAHTKRPGVVQDLSRLSFWSSICQLRKTNLPMSGDTVKILGPRLLSSTQWGILCPIHTPDGGNIGMHKHLALTTHITTATSGYPLIRYLRSLGMKILEESSLQYLSQTTKLFVNGAWVGSTSEPEVIVDILRKRRRIGLFSPYTSIRWNIAVGEIIMLTDGGRPSHPLLYIEGDKISYEAAHIIERLANNKLSWREAVRGYAKPPVKIALDDTTIYGRTELYGNRAPGTIFPAILGYVDTSEMEGVRLARYNEPADDYIKNSVTHIEIHPSVILGVMANQIIYPSNNQYPRDLFSCGQSKQAISLYSTNYRNRMDKTAYVLQYGQTPITKSRYFYPITKGRHPYGVNAMVAVASYTGYNVEDAVIFNKASLNRGMFGTLYLTVYEAVEEEVKVGNLIVQTDFMDVNKVKLVGQKIGYDYSHLDPESGLIRENTLITDKTILIGMASNSLVNAGVFVDASIAPKRGAIGYVDRAFMTTDEDGKRLAKVRIRQLRIPAIGDKFCSRAGQKGTIGIVLAEADMPFTHDGLRPDIIVNPHAFPSRMTIGHLVEVLVGKACLVYGAFGESTAFLTKGPKDRIFGELLTRAGFSSTGNAVMYSGLDGTQLEMSVYFGPTFYLRLKHMVKDKINYRARGPRTVLTRQTVQGRANMGGLRIGEMDRDALIAHGAAAFIKESMMLRGDQYYMAVCNKTGTIAIYNPSRDLFLSPMIDGPIKFINNLEDELSIVPISRFGREFSVLSVPYSFKLLYQELQAMNCQMRIITADNVDQLTSLVHGTDRQQLTGTDIELPSQLGHKMPMTEAKQESKKADLKQIFARPEHSTPFAAAQPRPAAPNPWAPPGTWPVAASADASPPLPSTVDVPASPKFEPSPDQGETGPGYPVSPLAEGSASPKFEPSPAQGEVGPGYPVSPLPEVSASPKFEPSPDQGEVGPGYPVSPEWSPATPELPPGSDHTSSPPAGDSLEAKQIKEAKGKSMAEGRGLLVPGKEDNTTTIVTPPTTDDNIQRSPVSPVPQEGLDLLTKIAETAPQPAAEKGEERETKKVRIV